MDKFQDVYRQAARDLPKLSMDAERVRDKAHHRRMLAARYKHLAARGCAAAAAFLLFGAGTVAAKNYQTSVIQVREGGFVITGMPDGANSYPGGVFSSADVIPDGRMASYDLDVEEMAFREYDSLEEFLETGETVAAVPDKAVFGVDFTAENIQVMEGGSEVFIMLSGEDSYFFLSQFDNRGVEGYSTGMTFGGETVDERSFTNSQGLSYVVFDTVDEGGRRVHAVISVNGWDLSMTFSGFGEETVDRVLDSLDLTIYFQN